ncbi:Sec-independent protein translocase protein TatB [Actibacterium sp. XHP0104]|uniref:Sec-independent protein translocase protein TatB n=1 Tax=Actibacterium sp. XHP0104 TaxID=2984335 RepID=UPI0021E7D9C3|nr:Sec-independent protein translocase protein TatB [Actibacterium sp. XHP0104]MCV2880711.1 Sec-independent protein translocase protein TatB [Actibacterium sp. XHP0104]
MFDLGWSELLVIGVVALIVVGPKDLPGMFRTLGRFTAKAKRLARDFQRAMDEAADEAGVKDVATDLRTLSNPRKMGMDALKDATAEFEKWEPKFKDEGLSDDRAEAARKISEAAAKKASDRKSAEAAAAEAETDAAPQPDVPPAPKKAPAKKAPAKKATAKKAPAKKAAPKKTAAKAGPKSAKKSDA